MFNQGKMRAQELKELHVSIYYKPAVLKDQLQ